MARWRVVSSMLGPLGVDGTIRGAGGDGHLSTARSSGADALRTWGLDELPRVLPMAEAKGLRVSAGIWLPHPPSFYENCTDLSADPFWRAELEQYVAAVRVFKNSPAILWWTVGNEMELETDLFAGNDCVWKRVEWAVQAVKAEDPNHPVGTVLAGCLEPKVRNILRLTPSLEFLGLNSYGDDALKVGPDLRDWGWTKPYALMEFGPSGHWASPTTEWDAYIEESTTEKAVRYSGTCHTCFEDDMCIGSFAFVWGWKWEKTGTWYNLFNEWDAVTHNVAVDCPNCQSEVMASLEKCWTGTARRNLPPSIFGVQVDGAALPDLSFVAPQKFAMTLEVNATHPLGKDMVAIWAVTEELVSGAIGGAFEETNPLLHGVWAQDAEGATSAGLSVTLNTAMLKTGGMYRLYVFVRQDPSTCAGPCPNQEAAASLPFYICHTARRNETCYGPVSYAMQTGIHVHPQTYPGLHGGSSFEEFQVLLHQKGQSACPAPCGFRQWCYTSVEGEECYGHVRWAMEHGIYESPAVYPLPLRTGNATFEMFQQHVYQQKAGICPRPCASGGRRMFGMFEEDDRMGTSAAEAAARPWAALAVAAALLAHPPRLAP